VKIPLQITFRNVPSSRIVKDWICAEAAKLETFYDRPMGCHVAVEVPHRHHKNGSLYHVRVNLTLPGGEIVVKREPTLDKRLSQTGESAVRKRLELHREHRDLHLAIHESFNALARRLKDYARRQRGDVKSHSLHPTTTAKSFRINSDGSPRSRHR
jgi:ribosome-associated translation inhibitor RaiA